MERANGAIELKPVQSTPSKASAQIPGILSIYDELRQQEKDKKHKEKLERAFVGANADEEMKFSHSIQFNAVPDWSNQYIAYSNLKKLIYTLEKEVNQRAQALTHDAESTALLDSTAGDPDKAFVQALDHELRKIESFYTSKEAEIFQEVEDLLSDEDALTAGAEAIEASQSSQSKLRRDSSAKPRRDSIFKDWGLPGRRRTSVSKPAMETIDSEDSDDEADERGPLRKTSTFSSMGQASTSGEIRRRPSMGLGSESDGPMTDSMHVAATTKRRMVHAYVSLCELRSYVQLNRTGFTKVLKKYDKTLDRKLKQKYIADNVEKAPTFQQPTTDKIDERLQRVEQTYADIYTEGDVEKAKRELRLDLREHVVWERNTVWREMIGIERKAQAAHLGVRPPILGKQDEQKHGDDNLNAKEFNKLGRRIRCPAFVFNSSVYILICAVAVFAALLSVPMFHLPEQQNCLAMIVFVSILWATEVRSNNAHS